MTHHLDHIAARVLNRPLLIQADKLGVIAQILAGRVGLDLEAPELGLTAEDRPEPVASRFVGSRRDAASGKGLPYTRTDSGTAILTITGSLVNRGAWIGASSGLTSYEGIAAQVRAAIEDPQVTNLLYDINSPGGEATGAFELAEIIRAAGEVKPSTAFVNGLAASAGYMIASGAQRIVSIPSGMSGSIGVVMMHADYSRMLDRAGVTPTFIFAGKHKVDANPYQPLDADTKARLTAEAEKMRGAFAQTVEAGRGKRLTAAAALATEADIFTGADAKAAGLVDDLATFDALYDDMNRAAARAQTGGRSPSRRAATMFTQADLDAAKAEGHAAGKAEGLATGKTEGHAAGLAEGKTLGAAAERTRIKGIVESKEAKGREGLAAHFAYATDVSVETAESALKAGAKGSSLADRAKAAEAGAHVAEADRKAPVIDAVAIYASLNKR